ncbi:hypothetical protein AB0N64_05745 [Microbacterium sp. NPDC089318]
MSSPAAHGDHGTLQTQLTLSLGQVRAEYSPDEEVFSTFSTPVYWGELVGTRPCVLVGGRGTGKTTTLRGLAYGGQSSLHGPDIDNWDTIGAYWRIDSMVASAFAGRGIPEDQWISAFSHYVNLRMVGLYLGFCEWRRTTIGDETAISTDAIQLAATSLNVGEASSLSQLSQEVKLGLARLEARLNGATTALFETPFSLLGRPLAYLLDGLAADDRIARLPFTYCIDEFENLRGYQQRALNTLIKHVGDSTYTIKIGIRDTEQRQRDTLAVGQPLVDPADYTTVDIVEHLKERSFAKFAAAVCERRLVGTDLSGMSMVAAFPGLSIEREAELLGADRERGRVRKRLIGEGASKAALDAFDQLPTLSACLVGYWANSQSVPSTAVLHEALSDPRAWAQRVGNYSYAMLFTLRRGLRGVRKYYAGWTTYCQLANGNIRLVLELAYQALNRHVAEARDPLSPVSFAHQTEAAADVGQATLRELQGQSGIGGQLTRLTLSLGRVFNVFAAAPEGHTPEVNQIRIESGASVMRPRELDQLLAEAVANGCLIAFPGDKQERVSAQTKGYDYQLHPIFAPYFVYSHRRKRRVEMRADEILALSGEGAARAINEILQTRRGKTPDLPEQLEFYTGFYDESN